MGDFIPAPYKASLFIPGADSLLYTFPIFPNLVTAKKITPRHWHDYFQIYYNAQGEHTHYINGENFIFKPGDAIIVPPFMMHRTDLSESDMQKLRLYRICIHPKVMENYNIPLAALSYKSVAFENKIIPKIVSFQGEDKATVDEIIYKMLDETEKKSLYNCAKMARLLRGILELCSKTSEQTLPDKQLQKKITRMQLISKTADYIHEKHRDRNLTVDEISSQIFMSRRNFSDAFLEYTGFTCHAYIAKTRLRTSYHSIRRTTKSIEEIAKESGFANSSHLSSVFKREFDCTPIHFRHEYSEWQKKYGDAMFKEVLAASSWVSEPDEQSLINHYTSMQY